MRVLCKNKSTRKQEYTCTKTCARLPVTLSSAQATRVSEGIQYFNLNVTAKTQLKNRESRSKQALKQLKKNEPQLIVIRYSMSEQNMENLCCKKIYGFVEYQAAHIGKPLYTKI